MLDVQRAIRTVRAKAKEHGIRPDRIGVWGFSAGGHLASTAATHFDAGKPDSDRSDRPSQLPAGFRHPRVPGHLDGEAAQPTAVRAETCSAPIPIRSWWN